MTNLLCRVIIRTRGSSTSVYVYCYCHKESVVVSAARAPQHAQLMGRVLRGHRLGFGKEHATEHKRLWQQLLCPG